MKQAYIIDAIRTPIARSGGALAGFSVSNLLAPLIQKLLQRSAIEPELIDEVIVGNAAGPGGNPARVALLEAGLAVSVPGMTVDRQCGSGLEAINTAVRMIQCGEASLVMAGGVESASTAPFRAIAQSAKSLDQLPPSSIRAPDVEGWHFYDRARFTPEFMPDPDMGVAAENVARKYGITRQQQDSYALESHRRATAANSRGDFKAEILPLRIAGSAALAHDNCVRTDCSLEGLAALTPVFEKGGSVTAGNACPVNDGAALVLVSAEPVAGALEYVASAVAGVSPDLLGSGPVPATRKLLSRCSLTIDDIDLIEFNEAFAAQVLACAQALQLPADKMNLGGGALALGHPYGASGAVLVTRLFHQMKDRQTGLATLGIGGGMGLSSLFRRV